MALEEGQKIERAAIVLLHLSVEATGSRPVEAALRQLPPVGPISLRAARELLETIPAWQDAAKAESVA
jgi:hypothetical protein